MPRARCANGVCAVGDTMLVIGGVESVAGVITVVDSILEFDSDTQVETHVIQPSTKSVLWCCVSNTGVD